MTKLTLITIVVPFAAVMAWGQTTSPDTPLTSLPYSPSLDLSSMDRTVDPCTDFYRYSCGSWIKNNPIPPDQARWNVYSKLANENQRFLWGILEQAAKPTPGRSAVETQIGDYFFACMDEGSREKAGAAPLRADLDKIAALKSVSEVAGFLAQAHTTTAGNQMLFGFGSNQDYADSSRVIAFVTAGGLGLPDRDYYVKTDAKSEEIRQRYVEHVQKMLELAGEPAPQAETDAQTVMTIETALAKASLTRVDQRDPHKLFHPFTLAKLQALTPAFPWKQYFMATAIDPRPQPQCHRAGVLHGITSATQSAQPGRLENLSALAPGAPEGAAALLGLRHRQFRFL